MHEGWEVGGGVGGGGGAVSWGEAGRKGRGHFLQAQRKTEKTNVQMSDLLLQGNTFVCPSDLEI